MDPSANLNDTEKGKFLPPQGLELVQPVASRYTDCTIKAPRFGITEMK
jgi:hypothetical protein